MPLARWLPLLFITACDDPRLSEVVVRDSADVRIVEHPSGFAALSWLIGETPTIDIGSSDGDSSRCCTTVDLAGRGGPFGPPLVLVPHSAGRHNHH